MTGLTNEEVQERIAQGQVNNNENPNTRTYKQIILENTLTFFNFLNLVLLVLVLLVGSEFYHLDGTENVPEDYKEISFVCLRPDGSLELPSTLGIVCRKIAQKLDGFEGFHFLEIPTQELIILLSGFLISEPSGRLSCDTSSGSIISFPPVFFSFTPL